MRKSCLHELASEGDEQVVVADEADGAVALRIGRRRTP
jgi:hypothetical protein